MVQSFKRTDSKDYKIKTEGDDIRYVFQEANNIFNVHFGIDNLSNRVNKINS